MNELSKKDLLEMRMSGFPNLQGQLQPLMSSSSDCDSNLSKHQLPDSAIEESQKSLNENESRSRGRKRKSFIKEAVTNQTKLHVDQTISSMLITNNECVPSACPISIPQDISIEALNRQKAELEAALQNMHEKEKHYIQTLDASREWLKSFLINDVKSLSSLKYKLRKKQIFESSIENCKKLGHYITVRKGTQFVEEWQHGYAFKNVEESIIENNRMKDELEKNRKTINKRKPSDKSCVGIRSPTDKSRRPRAVLEETSISNVMLALNQILSIEEFQRCEELYKIRINILRREECELNIEKEKLERERDLHIKNLKRTAMENASRFNDNPILNNRYILLELIGRGGFSEVFKAFDLKEFKYMACKIHQLSSEWRDEKKANYIKHAVREYNIHKTLDHPNIVKLLDVFEIDNDSFATIMEYCDGNDLDSLLKQQKCIPEREARYIIVQVVLALRYLNERRPPVIHYDLKPGNILLLSGSNAWHVKITDFGLSKIVPEDIGDASMELTSPGAGTYWYLPPECFLIGLNPTKISSKVDVWSIGVIFYQCLYGKKPFGNELSQVNILEQHTILNATVITFPPKPFVSNDAKTFIKCCLVYSKENRMDVIRMSESAYLKCKKSERVILPQIANIKIEDNIV